MKKQASSKHLSKKKRNAFAFHVFLGLFAVLVLYAGTYLIADSERFLITGFTFSGNETYLERDLHDSVREIFFTKHGIFPEKSYLTLPKGEVKQYLLKKFPAFADIELSFREGIVDIVFTEREPEGIWCWEDKKEGLGEICHFFDAAGIVYGKAPSFSGSSFLKISSHAPSKDIVYGDAFLTGKRVEEYNALVDFLHVRSIETSSIHLVDSFDLQVFVKSLFGERVPSDSYIRIDRQDLVPEERDLWLPKALTALSRSEEFINSLFTYPDNFEYADVRFRGQIYYKFSHFYE
jgi:hypothetical protein